MADIITSPVKFLGATVLSFNTTIGLGSSSESTLSVELVEDCDAGDLFLPANNGKEVGDSIFFQCGVFTFGGVLTSWTINQSGSGKTYSVRASDPRQLLDNFVLLVDTEMSNVPASNVLNLWSYWESPGTQSFTDSGSKKQRNPVLPGFTAGADNIPDPQQGNFGMAQTSERGMKYRQIIDALEALQNQVTIYSNTGYAFTVDFSTFPNKLLVPDFYRIQGHTTILGLLQNICDILGYEFYVSLLPGNIISIGLIDLKQNPGSFAGLIAAFDGCATDISYGQELRQDKLKTIIYGDKWHDNYERYNMFMYFGCELFEDSNGNKILQHVVPHAKNDCGFWISKMITTLNSSMHIPIPKLPAAPTKNGPYSLSEFDIRAAMSSFKLWKARVFDDTIPGSLNRAIRGRFPDIAVQVRNAINNIANQQNAVRGVVDAIQNPIPQNVLTNKDNEDNQDLEKVYAFVKQIGDTYYGKQYLVDMTDTIEYALEDDNVDTIGHPEQSHFMFSKVPTNAGGWEDPNGSVLTLSDPDLQFFRNDDGRVGCFAKFDIEFTNAEPAKQKWYIISGDSGCVKCSQQKDNTGAYAGPFEEEAQCTSSLNEYTGVEKCS